MTHAKLTKYLLESICVCFSMFSNFTVDDYHLSLGPDYTNSTWNDLAEEMDLATPLCCSDVEAVPSYDRLLYFFWPSATPRLFLPYLSLSLYFLPQSMYAKSHRQCNHVSLQNSSTTKLVHLTTL